MEIIKDTLWIASNERIKAIEIFREKRRVFYNYSYELRNGKGVWRTRIVWHDSEHNPHYDVFDENGKLIVHKEQDVKNIDEILKLVKVFRKNLMNMDLSAL